MKPFPQPTFLGSPVGMEKSSSPITSVTPATMGATSLVASGQTGQTAVAPVAPSWQGRAIATHKLRLLEFSAYVDQQRNNGGSEAQEAAFNSKHLFVHIGGQVSYNDPVLEVRKPLIYDPIP